MRKEIKIMTPKKLMTLNPSIKTKQHAKRLLKEIKRQRKANPNSFKIQL